VDRPQLLTLTAPEMTVLVGGLRVRRQTDGISSEVKFAPGSPQEGDGFEPSVPHGIGPFGRTRTGLEPDEGRRLKTGTLSPGTDSSNPALSSGESAANREPLKVVLSGPTVPMRRRESCRFWHGPGTGRHGKLRSHKAYAATFLRPPEILAVFVEGLRQAGLPEESGRPLWPLTMVA